MALYKFLRHVDGRALGPFSDFPWPVPDGPAPGPWVEAAPPLDICGRGVHVCRPVDLPHWLNDELWEVEVAGEVLEDDDKVVVERARLVARVGGWPERATAFMEDCVWALRDQVVEVAEQEGLQAQAGPLASADSIAAVEDAVTPLRQARSRDVVLLADYLGDAVAYAALAQPAIVAFIAAHAADRAPGRPGRRLPRGTTAFDLERRRQADWLKAALGVT